ncbi:MAG TPA: VWA domain-containing protein [Chitinophagaceae bacterium]|nr:VWA domain-containing protein [Chitinophagaceae bacterium]
MTPEDLKNISFAYPAFFILLALAPLIAYWHIRSGRRQLASLKVSSLEGLKQIPPSWKTRLRPLLLILRILGILFISVALARPQLSNVTEDINSEGIDIVICLDISGSMLAEDFQPNRVEAAKELAVNFVKNRPGDRIGFVIFAGESFTQCPITTDHAVLENQIMKVNTGLLEDGTAIGMGLATGIQRLKDSKAKSKVIILLTDGVNNTGLIDPLTALEIAKVYGIKIYTIGIGTNGVAPYPVQTPLGTQLQDMQVQIDEPLLRKIAEETGGLYFRATDNNSLAAIYKRIDKMEKTKVKITSYKRYEELFYPFALAAIALLLLEVLLRYTIFRSLP